MSVSQRRARALVAPLLLGMVGLIISACAPEPTYPPYYGIYFQAPTIGYIGKSYVPKATATSGLPVTLTLDATSTGCTFDGTTVTYLEVGTCVINANQAGDATHAPAAQVQRKIVIHPCPPLRSGIWTGPLNLSANVVATGNTFTGTVDLSSLGFGVQLFAGTVTCDVANMTFNGVPLTGRLSYDGSVLTSNYNGIEIVLNAPPAAA
jgi:hypothetical protein